MSSFTGQELADYLYYKKLPPLYANADESETEKRDLYRYLQAVIQGGFNDTLEQITTMTELVNPQTCPVEYLPYLYASYGLPYFEDIGEYYNRRFLSSVGELLRRRGTIGGVRYLVRVLTGMESEIGYRRVMTETEHARYLDVFPNFPDVTSLAEVEVTAYTIKRFLDLHLPFYIRTNFFPFIETQDLYGEIRNGVSFANTLAQFLFSERERILLIKNNRGVGIYGLNNYSLAENENKQDLISHLGGSSFLNTKMLSYDLTQLLGKKLQIGDWITNGNFRLNLNLSVTPFIDVVFSTEDLFYTAPKNVIIPLNRGIGLFSYTQNNLIDTDKKVLAKKFKLLSASDAVDTVENISRNIIPFAHIKSLTGMDTREYNLTGMSGEKQFVPNFIKEKYFLNIGVDKAETVTVMSIHDLTFLKGKNIITDGSGLYDRDYKFKHFRAKVSKITDLKTYRLDYNKKQIHRLDCRLNTVNVNYSVISYDLRKGRENNGRN